MRKKQKERREEKTRNRRGQKEKIRASVKSFDGAKQVTSITRQINRHIFWEKFAIVLGCSLLLYLAAVIIFLLGSEIGVAGGFDLNGCRRSLYFSDQGRLIYEVVRNETGKAIVCIAMRGYLVKGLMVDLGVFAVMVMRIFIGKIHDSGEIAKMLDPINELALKVDELSKMTFSEDKFRILEDAIGEINPEEAQNQNQMLSLGDSELAGVEAAMNNLLIRMRDTYRQQARFVNDASHELRTPIAVIQGYANMLDRWGKKDETILEESIAAIKNESDHMNHLVEQLLFLARGDAGRTAFKPEPTDLRAMMQEVYEESFMIDEKHPYRFRTIPETAGNEPIFMEADQGLLKQAVRILIDNAAKYTASGDEILLGCGVTEKGEPFVQVQDTGIGMAEADVQHMFERFYRSDEVRSYQGTGLGLSIAKWIVDRHHGHFEILSRVELGTRIRIVFGSFSPYGKAPEGQSEAS